MIIIFILLVSAISLGLSSSTPCAEFEQCLVEHSFNACYAWFQGDGCSAQDCEYGDWTAWSLCSVSCGGGRQQQRRRAADKTCNVTRTVRICNAQPCYSLRPSSDAMSDCAVNEWSVWSECSRTCGPGLRQRHRTFAQDQLPTECVSVKLVTAESCFNLPCEDTTPIYCQMANRPLDQGFCPSTKEAPLGRKMWYFDSFSGLCRQFELYSCEEPLYGVHNAYATAHTCWMYCDTETQNGKEPRIDCELDQDRLDPCSADNNTTKTLLCANHSECRQERDSRVSLCCPISHSTESLPSTKSLIKLLEANRSYSRSTFVPLPFVSKADISDSLTSTGTTIQWASPFSLLQEVTPSKTRTSPAWTPAPTVTPELDLDQHCTELGRPAACEGAEAWLMYYYDNTLDECLAFAYCPSEQDYYLTNRYETLIECSKQCQGDGVRLCYGNEEPQTGLDGSVVHCDGACEDGFVCTDNEQGVCCPAYNQEYFARSYNPPCETDTKLVWRQNAPLLGRSCADNLCPVNTKCEQGFRLFAYCCQPLSNTVSNETSSAVTIRHKQVPKGSTGPSNIRRARPPTQIRPWCRQLLPEHSTDQSPTNRHNFYETSRGRWIADLHCRQWCKLGGSHLNGCCDLHEWKCQCSDTNCAL